MKPKLAIFTVQLPGLDSGTPVRNFHLLHGLKKDFDITLYCFLNEKVDEHTFKEEIHKNTRFYYQPYSSSFERLFWYVLGKVPFLERLKKYVSDFQSLQIDPNTCICLFHELNSWFVLEKFSDQLPGKKILDAHNVEYIKIQSEISAQSPLMQFLGKRIIRTIKYAEEKALGCVDHIFTCSLPDADYFSQYISRKKITVVPNGVNCDYFIPRDSTNNHTLLFMGLMSYQPNNDAMQYFIFEIYPLIKKKYPDSTLTITGKDSQQWLIDYGKEDPSIKLTGFVKDVRKEMGTAAVCICPLRSGSGTRLKILEYLAMGKAIVSTSIGAEGIDVKDGENILIANSPDTFADRISDLFESEKLTNQLGKAARKLAEEKYQWKTILNELLGTIHKKIL